METLFMKYGKEHTLLGQLKNCIEVNVGYITLDGAFVNVSPDFDTLIQFSKKFFVQKFCSLFRSAYK